MLSDPYSDGNEADRTYDSFWSDGTTKFFFLKGDANKELERGLKFAKKNKIDLKIIIIPPDSMSDSIKSMLRSDTTGQVADTVCGIAVGAINCAII